MERSAKHSELLSIEVCIVLNRWELRDSGRSRFDKQGLISDDSRMNCADARGSQVSHSAYLATSRFTLAKTASGGGSVSSNHQKRSTAHRTPITTCVSTGVRRR
jgi:hypothetical protein